MFVSFHSFHSNLKFYRTIVTFIDSNMPLTFVISERGKQQLLHDGEDFDLNRHKNLTNNAAGDA